jgi:hypothetical protein
LWRFVTTPSDLANSFDAMFALAGPTVDREFQPVIWTRFVWRAYRHGRRTPPLACVAYEDLLPKSLDVVRHEIGMPAMSDTHPTGVPEKGWLLDLLEKNVQLV